MKRALQAQSVVVIILALLLFPFLLNLLRVPVGVGLFLVLNPLCPCIASACTNCACDACVFKVLATIMAVLIVVPLLFYFLVMRKSRLD